MGASDGAGQPPTRVPSAPVLPGGLQSVLLLAAVAGALLYCFPLFHVVPLRVAGGAAATTGTAAPAAFNAAAAAARIWQADLPAARAQAVALGQLAPALRASAEAARTRFAPAAGLGTAYFFVRGSGRVVARERNVLRLAPAGAEAELIAIRLGPVFGNTVRDGCGLLDVNAFPGLQEFNALSAELNALVERTVLPVLREKALVGTTVDFVGCAEAPESAPAGGEPLLTVVPVQAEVR